MTTTTSSTLTSHLRSLHEDTFTSATKTPTFLRAAASTDSSSLPLPTLNTWLTQDRLYAQSYVRFASLLLANVPQPRTPNQSHINVKVANCLIGALANVSRELKFFEETAAKFGLSVTAFPEGVDGEGKYKGMAKPTRDYVQLFEKVGDGVEKGERSVLEGMVLLWGTEICYLTAWTTALTHLKSSSSTTTTTTTTTSLTPPQTALHNHFITNWTSPEFIDFVNEIRDLTNEMWSLQNDSTHDSEEGKRFIERLPRKGGDVALGELEKIWEEVLDVEVRFWPDV